MHLCCLIWDVWWDSEWFRIERKSSGVWWNSPEIPLSKATPIWPQIDVFLFHHDDTELTKIHIFWCAEVEKMLQICRASLRWRHNGRDGVSNHQPHDCLHNRLFGCRSKKTSKLRVTGLCAGNSLGTGEFSAQMASKAENVSMSWRRHDSQALCQTIVTA